MPGVSAAELSSHPAVNVSWLDASRFCAWLSDQPGMRGARLPSQEEWEWFCRAATATTSWFGDHEPLLAHVGCYDENSGRQTHRVGEKPPNPWGFYDVHGKVWEWTSRAWGAVDGSRAVRGGSGNDSMLACAVQSRVGGLPDWRDSDLGFRVVRPVGGRT